MNRLTRSFADLIAPKLSVEYRRLRDNAYFTRLRPRMTDIGLQLYCDEGIAESREASYETKIFLSELDKADALIDVGANSGFFTCIAAARGAKVYAFEPNLQNLQLLYRNLELNKLANVEVFPVAVSYESGILPLYGGRQGSSLLRGWGGMTHTYSNYVPVHTLDALLASRLATERLLVKVDVEGSEYNVIRGAGSLLSRSQRTTWIVEHGLNENWSGCINPNFEALFNLFWENGYNAHTIEQDPRPVSAKDVERWVTQEYGDFGSINFLFSRTTD